MSSCDKGYTLTPDEASSQAPDKGCVLTIGKFESLHIGHQALIREVQAEAQNHGLPAIVLAFAPHPYKILRDPSYAPLFTSEERLLLADSLGIALHEYPFTSETMALSADDFCNEIIAQFAPKVIVTGEGYRFGKNRAGSAATFEKSGIKVKTLTLHGEASTSEIRSLLAKSEIKKAQDLLGFPYHIVGEVAQGKQLGRTIGFPTANIYPTQDKFLPPKGVYATRTHIQGKVLDSITNIGNNPTAPNPLHAVSVETHVLPLNTINLPELYGSTIRVDFHAFIRPETRFANLDELRAQILTDINTCSSLLRE